MKVIKDNYYKPTDIICWKCSSVLQVGIDDVTKNLSGHSIIKCPLCNAEIYINAKDFVK